MVVAASRNARLLHRPPSLARAATTSWLANRPPAEAGLHAGDSHGRLAEKEN
jgi:hypothetical protein